jgi:hypothetical protein
MHRVNIRSFETAEEGDERINFNFIIINMFYQLKKKSLCILF